MSGRGGSGSFGSGRTAGYAIGEGRTSPWLEAIAEIRQRSCPRLGSKPVPAPRTRYEVRCGRDRDSSTRLPSASKCVRGRVCGAEPRWSARGAVCVIKRVYIRWVGVACTSKNRFLGGLGSAPYGNNYAGTMRDCCCGFSHDATRLATLHNSAMPGPLTPRHKGTVYWR